MQVFRFFAIIKFRATYFWTSQGPYWPLIDKVGLTVSGIGWISLHIILAIQKSWGVSWFCECLTNDLPQYHTRSFCKLQKIHILFCPILKFRKTKLKSNVEALFVFHGGCLLKFDLFGSPLFYVRTQGLQNLGQKVLALVFHSFSGKNRQYFLNIL